MKQTDSPKASHQNSVAVFSEMDEVRVYSFIYSTVET